jgi:WD40 repeat protein
VEEGTGWTAEALAPFIVRFPGPAEGGVGLGALVGPRHVITCAHVVNAALGLDLRSQDRPDSPVRITFPLLSDSLLTATVASWHPLPQPGEADDDGADVASLIVEGDLPPGATPGILAGVPPRPGTPVRVFGYPVSAPRPAGINVTAIVRGQVAHGRLQIDSVMGSALRVQPGFSGSPVFDDSAGQIVGLIALAPFPTTQASDSQAIGVDALRAACPEALGGAFEAGSFPALVAEATALRFPGATITELGRRGSWYLRVGVQQGNGMVEVRLVGIIDGTMSDEALASFMQNVQKNAGDFPSELVYRGEAASPHLTERAREQGVRLRSITEYQGLLDLSPLVRAQSASLLSDSDYPAQRYVEQRYMIVSDGPPRTPDSSQGLVHDVIHWLSADPGRLIVVLGEFGQGKTSFMRQLALRLPGKLGDLWPILVKLRDLETGTLHDLLAQYLNKNGVADVTNDKLRYMIDNGRVALLLDGFDELEFRVGYDGAAEHLETLLTSLTGRGKVVLTSRTQHFRSTQQLGRMVRTALGQRVEARTGTRVVILEDFAPDQVRQFLTSLYEGEGEGEEAQARRIGLIAGIAGLMETARNPRMLALIARLADKRLREVRSAGGQLSAASLYEEVIDYWLADEEERQRRGRGLPWLTKDERFTVCTNLALRLWQSGQAAISRHELTDEVVTTLSRLAERGFSDEQATHWIAAGSLLIRADDDVFAFVDQSVMEWLAAAHLVSTLVTRRTAPALASRQMSRLMAAFFADLAGRERALVWAGATMADPRAPEAAKQNALAVLAHLTPSVPVETGAQTPGGGHAPAAPTVRTPVIDLAGVDLRNRDLNGLMLRDASLRGAIFRGMRLDSVDLSGADLTGADLTDVVMTGGSLRGATLTGSTWNRAAILGAEGTGDPVLAAAPELAAAAITGRDQAEVITNPPNAPAGYAARSGCVAFSPDGGLLAFGAERVIRIASSGTGRVLRVLSGHQDEVTSIAFSADGALIAAGSLRGAVYVWDAATGVSRGRYAPYTGTASSLSEAHPGPVTAVAFSPDSGCLATGAADSTVRVWNTASGESCFFRTTGGPVRTVAFFPDGTLLAAASDSRYSGYGDGKVSVWDAASWRPVSAFARANQGVDTLAFARDRCLIAVAYGGGLAQVYDAVTGAAGTTFSGGQDGHVLAVAFSPDDSLIAACASRPGGSVHARTFDAASGTERTKATFTHPGRSVLGAALSPDAALTAVAYDDQSAVILDTATGALRATLNPRGPAPQLAVAARRIATASADGTTRIWDISPEGRPAALAWSAQSRYLLALSPDGTRLATVSDDGITRIWDTSTGTQLATIATNDSHLVRGAFSADGTRFAGKLWTDQTVRLWDSTTGAELRTLARGKDRVRTFALSPDGTLAVLSSEKGVAWLADTATGIRRATLLKRDITAAPDFAREFAREFVLTAVAFSPDGTTVAGATINSRTKGGIVRLWDLPGTPGPRLPRRAPLLRERCTLGGHDDEIRDLAFSPDGTLAATASADRTARIWTVADGRSQSVPFGHDGPVDAVAFFPDGKALMTSSPDGLVHLLDIAAGTTRAHLAILDDGGIATLLPDGSYGLDGDPGDRLWWAIKLCRFDPGELDPYVPEINLLAR